MDRLSGQAQASRLPRMLVPLATLTLLFAGVIPPATVLATTPPPPTSVTLYNNFPFGGTAPTALPTLSTKFVPSVSGKANLVSVATQCLSNQQANGCSSQSGPATIALYTDSGNSPGTLLTTSPSYQPPSDAPAAGNCLVMPSAPTLTAGTAYWAVLTGNNTSWYPGNNGGLSLRVDQGGACSGHLVPNPVDGTPIANMFPRSGHSDVNTITFSNDGIGTLNLTGWDLSVNPDSVFQLLVADIKDTGGITPATFPQHYTLDSSAGNVVIIYVTCTPPTGGPEAHYTSTLTFHTDDPSQPTISWPLSCYVDNTPPVITISDFPDGNAPWHKTVPASMSAFGDDGPIGSGTVLVSCNVGDTRVFFTDSSSGGPFGVAEPPALEGLNSTTISCIAQDAAGNVTPTAATMSISIDTRPRVISASVVPAPNGAGWNNTDVAISFSCGDDPTPGSGNAANTVGGGGPFTAETPNSGTDVANTGSCLDVAGNVSATKHVTLKIDKTPPSSTTIVTSPPAFPARTRDTVGHFTFTGIDALSGVAGFSCSLDNTTAVPCTASYATAALADGGHNLTVKAVDVAGNTDPVGASFAWYVDTSPPTVTFDGPAEGGLTKGAGDVTFHATDPDDTTGFTYTCALDANSAAPCTSDFPYGFASTGSHTLKVIATDAIGNPGTEAALHWTVDTTAPTISFTLPAEGSDAAGTGSVAFTVGDPDDPTTPGATCSLDSQTAIACTSSYAYSGLPKGQHTLVVTGTDRVGNIGTGTLHFNVGSTTTALTSSANPSVTGQSVTFTATVTGLSGTPTGTVSFLIGGAPAGSGTLDGSGQATLTSSAVPTGSTTIEADYLGDTDFVTSSGTLSQTVNAAASSTSLSSSSNPSGAGTSVTFTATVSAVSPGSGTPTGTVNFKVDGSPVGSGTLHAGQATFTTSALAIGDRSVEADYAGSTTFLASGSSTLVQTVLATPSLVKSFEPPSIPLGSNTTLTFAITNPSATTSLTGVGFTDTLPSGLVVATPNGLTGTCGGGTINAVAGSSSVSLSGASLAGGANCTFSVNVTGTVAGSHLNTTSTVSSTEAGSGAAATATLLVVAPPMLAKSFGAATIALNGTTSLTFTLSNPNATASLTGVAFADNLPAGLVVATPNGLTGSCTGTSTAVAGSTSVSLTGSTLAASAICTLSVNVTSTTDGVKDNSATASSTNGGTGTPATASLTVTSPPQIDKSFGSESIPQNGSTTLSFTITNPNASVALSGVAFTDTLPTGVVVATPNGLTGSCGGGTITAVAGSGSVSLSGATLAATATCTLSVTVVGTAAGAMNNSVTVTSTNGGTGNTSTAALTVVAPPTATKSFGAASVPLGGTTSLTFTINNPNAGASLTGVAFTDTLPTGLVIATPSGLTGSCGGGTISAVAGSTSVSLSAATLGQNAGCTFSINVTGTGAGLKANSVTVGSTSGGTGNPATANLTVVAPPVLAKSFGVATVALNGTTSLSFTLTNTNTAATLNGIAFTDSLPTGLVVATPNGLTGSCGGGTITAVATSSSVSLSGATLAAGATCTFSVNVTGTTDGVKNNSATPGSANGGTGTAATATLTVVAAPRITKAFGAASIPLMGSTTLTFTITNLNGATALTGIAFTDTLPAGLVASPSKSVPAPACGGGTIGAVTESTVVSLSGATLAAGASCTFSITVMGSTVGTKSNSVTVTSTNGGTGNTSTAVVAVVAPPSIAKSFGAASVLVGGSTSLSFTLTNPNPSTALTGVAFTDSLPAGLVVAAPNGLTGACGGGTIGAVAGSGSVSLSGATLAGGASCTFSVKVTATTAGVKRNTVAATSANGGTGNTATASLTVAALADLTITATHAGNFRQLSAGTWLIKVSNLGPSSTFGLVKVVDSMPAGFTVLSMSGTGWSCSTSSLTCTRSDVLSAGSAYPAISLTVITGLRTPLLVTNSATVSGGGDTTPANDTANDPTTIQKSILP